MTVKDITEHYLKAAHASLSLHLSNCHIVGNHMLRLIIIPIRYVTMEKYEGLLSSLIMHISLQVSDKNSPCIHVTEASKNSLIATVVPAKSDSDVVFVFNYNVKNNVYTSLELANQYITYIDN